MACLLPELDLDKKRSPKVLLKRASFQRLA